MKLHLLLFSFLIALVAAVAVPDPDVDSTLEANYPGQPCRADWACPSSEFCNKKKKCQLRKGRCLKNKDCPKYMTCSDTHCFPHSRNGRRDVDESSGSDETEVVADIQHKVPCVNNTDCSSNETCNSGNCVLRRNRCWNDRDCSRRRRCEDTFCVPYKKMSRRDSKDEPSDVNNEAAPAPVDSSDEIEYDEAQDIGTADNIDVAPFNENTLLGLVTRDTGKRRNKCRRGCNTDKDCCRRDDCYMRVCLGPHRD